MKHLVLLFPHKGFQLVFTYFHSVSFPEFFLYFCSYFRLGFLLIARIPDERINQIGQLVNMQCQIESGCNAVAVTLKPHQAVRRAEATRHLPAEQYKRLGSGVCAFHDCESDSHMRGVMRRLPAGIVKSRSLCRSRHTNEFCQTHPRIFLFHGRIPDICT